MDGLRHEPHGTDVTPRGGRANFALAQYVIVMVCACVPVQVPVLQVPAWPAGMVPVSVTAWSAPVPLVVTAGLIATV